MANGTKWVQVPIDAYGYRAPGWTNQMRNMPSSSVSDYNSFHMYIIDDVEPGTEATGSASKVYHAYCCKEITDIFTNTFTDCTVHSVRMRPGQKRADFFAYFAQELQQCGPDDLVAFYFHGKSGGNGKKYTWKLRGPGPNSINATKFINQVNASSADCYFILDCFIPTDFPKQWERTEAMTEFTVAGQGMFNDNGRPINGPQNFTETLCRSMRRFARKPGERALPSLHHIMGRDKEKVSHPLRLWTARPDRRKKGERVWRFCIDAERYKATGRLEVRRCCVTDRREGDGEFLDTWIDDDDEDDDQDGGGGGGGDGGGGGGGGGDGGGGGGGGGDGGGGDGGGGDGGGGDGGGGDGGGGDGGDGDRGGDGGGGEGGGGGDDDGDDGDDGNNGDDGRVEGRHVGEIDVKRENASNDLDDDEIAGLRQLNRQLQADTKRKRDDHQERSGKASRVSQQSSPGSARMELLTSSNQDDLPIDLDDHDAGEESLFVSQSKGSQPSPESFKSSRYEETAMLNDDLDEQVMAPIEEDATINMSIDAGPSALGPSKGKQAMLPRLGGLLPVKPRHDARDSAHVPDTLDDPEWVAHLPTSALDEPSQTSRPILSQNIEDSVSIVGRIGNYDVVKRETSSPSFGLGGRSRLGRAGSVKRELSDEEGLVITGFSSKVIDPSANGTSVDLTLDD